MASLLANGKTAGRKTVKSETYSLDCKDYVMYEPPGRIWVPQGVFQWGFDGTASFNAGTGKCSINNRDITAPNKIVSHQA
jgi:hypothetical protein